MGRATPLFSVLAALALSLVATQAAAQCRPVIKVNGQDVIIDSTFTKGSRLPIWLPAGATLAASTDVNSISVLEFTVNAGALEFSQAKLVTTVQTVPAGKTWKVVSVLKTASTTFVTTGTLEFTVPGTDQWAVPDCITSVQIEVWGGGGGGGGVSRDPAIDNAGGGGGGGGYGVQTFAVVPGTVYNVTVGAGGAGGCANGGVGGASSVGALISATGGAGGVGGNGGNMAGGAGGTSTAATNVAGQPGSAGQFVTLPYSAGGDAGGTVGSESTGGVNNSGTANGGSGSGIGAGGAGATWNSNNTFIACVANGGSGSAGKVRIKW